MKYESVFEAYDIRGVVPKEIDAKFATLLGKAYVQSQKTKCIAIGYDGRSSSKKLFQALCKGINMQGCDVVEVGQCSTPHLYYAVAKGKYDGGIMITASHNAKQYNGFKLLGKEARPIHAGNGSLDILDLMNKNEFDKSMKKGKISKKAWVNEYKKYLKDALLSKSKQKIKLSELKLVVDQSNGSGKLECDVIKQLFPKTIILNSRIAGTFPGHEPNPLKFHARKQLVSQVKKQNADLGLIFDGDADRVCFIDELGEFVRPDLILLLLMDDLKKGKIVYEVRSSKYIPERANQKGLGAILSKAGRTNIVDVMKTESAEIGGEGSGHYFFKDFGYMDCAGLAAIKVLNKLIDKKPSDSKKFSEMINELNPYFHSGELNLKVKNQSKAFLLIEQGFKDATKTLYLDGLSFYYEDYWFNIRKSNTEPLLRINAEANSQKKLDEITKKITKLMKLVK
ncbi:phosphomannomutase/phosphoglucomutase [Candidatus Woesearchaeota archaeon]|nr:phosphomannomutase/phosphoglucomutase [Candidatus Woesearchaeota archaeon]